MGQVEGAAYVFKPGVDVPYLVCVREGFSSCTCPFHQANDICKHTEWLDRELKLDSNCN